MGVIDSKNGYKRGDGASRREAKSDTRCVCPTHSNTRTRFGKKARGEDFSARPTETHPPASDVKGPRGRFQRPTHSNASICLGCKRVRGEMSAPDPLKRMYHPRMFMRAMLVRVSDPQIHAHLIAWDKLTPFLKKSN